MKSLILLTGLLAGLAPSAALESGAERLAWSVAEGTRLRLDVTSHHSLAAERDERVTPEGSTISQRRFDIETTVRLSVVDELLARDAERPLKLARAYEASGFDASIVRSLGRQQTKDSAIQGKGSIEGTGVVFTWIPEDGEYGRYYDHREGVEEVLPGLEADLTLRGLVPTAPVAIGDSWTPPVGALRGLFSTGGDCDYHLEDEGGLALLRTLRVGLGMNLEQAFGGTEEGEVRATWIGVEEQDGRRLALLDLDFDVTLERDVTERAQASTSMLERARGLVTESARVRLALKGSGRLRWDLDGGHLHDTVGLAARERCRIELTQRTGGEPEDGSEPSSVTQLLVMAGRLEHSIVCTRLE
jgi:hypothetical protein